MPSKITAIRGLQKMTEELKQILRELNKYGNKNKKITRLKQEIRKKISDGDADELYLKMVNNVLEHLQKIGHIRG